MLLNNYYMSTNGLTVAAKVSKKEARKVVYEKLAAALAEYKNSLKEKRFVSNLKKASNLFAGDIVKAMKKSKGKVKNGKIKDKSFKTKKVEVKTTEQSAV